MVSCTSFIVCVWVAVAWYDKHSNATFCLAINLQAFSYICVLWMPKPQKMANASMIDTSVSVNDVSSSCTFTKQEIQHSQLGLLFSNTNKVIIISEPCLSTVQRQSHFSGHWKWAYTERLAFVSIRRPHWFRDVRYSTGSSRQCWTIVRSTPLIELFEPTTMCLNRLWWDVLCSRFALPGRVQMSLWNALVNSVVKQKIKKRERTNEKKT